MPTVAEPHTVHRLVELSGGRSHSGGPRVTVDACFTPVALESGRAHTAEEYDVVVTVRGELDAGAASALDPHVLHDVGQARETIVDLSEVTLIDSAGVRCLENLGAAVTLDGGRFVLRDPSEIVRHVLEILRLYPFNESPVRSE